jgi:cytochrome bd-type quinol oxidase subunit 2
MKWLGKEKVGLTGVAVSTAGLITTLLIHARGAIIGTAKATSKVAKALANLAKKAGPILVPIMNAIATALSCDAKGIAWLASHLWVLAVAAALLVYDYLQR